MNERGIIIHFPVVLKPKDRLFLEMAVIDGDIEEADRLINDYGVEMSEELNPLVFCESWLKSLKSSEKHHCQNIIDLHSQGKSIGGMQATADFTKGGNGI